MMHVHDACTIQCIAAGGYPVLFSTKQIPRALINDYDYSNSIDLPPFTFAIAVLDRAYAVNGKHHRRE